MDDFTLFYAWQSDTAQKANRFLIRDAVDDALKHINATSTIDNAPRLDHDTKNISGTPEIAGSIYEKIGSAGLFLADVTFVGKTSGGKQLSNPNVLLELGFAASKLGWERIILVMNSAYGTPDE